MARTAKRYKKNTEKKVSGIPVCMAAIYARLSVDSDEKKSESIETQVTLIKEFIQKHNENPDREYEIAVYDIYSDLGKTGTNFDRPGFERMMNDVRAGKINGILVKDFSRFGRNYIETGNYLEKILPFMKVRFVSVCDNYDSYAPDAKNQELSMNIKNLVNDAYAKDISAKERAAKRIAQKNGEYVGSTAPYGYSFELERLQNAGVNSIMLFGIPDHKDEVGSGAYDPNGIVQKALREAKKQFPDMYYITDVCMCEYTSHGHCGVLCGHDVNNDATLELLAKTAVSHVEAGADMVAPSDMMDGRVRAIREALDANGHYGAPIMSYAVKYASAFYGPFRDAAGSAPSFGDRKSYQMDFHNRREGMKEALTDVEEGADIIMVKPAMSYLDMVSEVSKAVNVPVAAYSVSGEYAMVKAAAKMGWIDEERIMCEMAVSAYRAGAQIYLTYYAKELAKCMDEGRIG